MHTLRGECEDRGIDTDDLDKKLLRESLNVHLSGIKRPPALLCTEMTLDLDNYDVASLEPLHDLKTIIGKCYNS